MKLLLVACGVALFGCNQGFEPQYLVKDLRILAIRAEAQGSTTADVAPGDVLVLRALVANPRVRGAPAVTWYACPPGPDESLPPCADLGFLSDPSRLATDPRVQKLGTCEPDAGGVCTIATALPDMTAALTFAIEKAKSDPAFSCLLFAELPGVAVAQADGAQHVAVKRVRVVPPAEMLAGYGLTGSYVTNANPGVSTIVRARPVWGTCTGGIDIVPDPFPLGETTLCAAAESGSSQQFEACGPAGEPTLVMEHAEWQWFVTAGEFPEFDGMVGNADRNEPRFVRPSGPFTIWTVVRDGRGGEGWLRRDVGAAP
jgi:hypothetical protein